MLRSMAGGTAPLSLRGRRLPECSAPCTHARQQRTALQGPRFPECSARCAGLGGVPAPRLHSAPGKPVACCLSRDKAPSATFPVDQSFSLVITVAPGTGPVAVATLRQTPVPDRATASSVAFSALLARKKHVGPDPDTSAPRAPASRPASSVLRSAGKSVRPGSCRSLLSAAPSFTGSPA